MVDIKIVVRFLVLRKIADSELIPEHEVWLRGEVDREELGADLAEPGLVDEPAGLQRGHEGGQQD